MLVELAGYDIARPTPDVDVHATNGAAAKITISDLRMLLSFKASERYLTSEKHRSPCHK